MFKQGDIIIIQFPFTDLSATKKRPALILSNDDYNDKTEDIIIAGITSKLSNKEYAITIDNDSLNTGKINYTSQIRVDKIYTVSKEIVLKQIANVKDIVLFNTVDLLNKLVKK